MRIFGGLVAGLIAAFATVWLIGFVGHSLYPLPGDLNLADFGAVGVYIQNAPLPAMLLVILSWFGGALLGGLVAVTIARAAWPAWLVAALVAGAAILNVMMIPHPTWMQLGAVIAPALGGMLAHHFGRRYRTLPAETFVTGAEGDA